MEPEHTDAALRKVSELRECIGGGKAAVVIRAQLDPLVEHLQAS